MTRTARALGRMFGLIDAGRWCFGREVLMRSDGGPGTVHVGASAERFHTTGVGRERKGQFKITRGQTGRGVALTKARLLNRGIRMITVPSPAYEKEHYRI